MLDILLAVDPQLCWEVNLSLTPHKEPSTKQGPMDTKAQKKLTVGANHEMPRLFWLQTDASDHGVGIVISQKGEDGLGHLIVFFSRKLLTQRGWIFHHRKKMPCHSEFSETLWSISHRKTLRDTDWPCSLMLCTLIKKLMRIPTTDSPDGPWLYSQSVLMCYTDQEQLMEMLMACHVSHGKNFTLRKGASL